MTEVLNTSIESSSIDDSDGSESEYPSFDPNSASKARERKQKQLEMIPRGDNYKTSSAIMSLYERYLNNAKNYRQKAEKARKGSTETSNMLKMAEIDEGSARLLEKILKEKYGIDPNSLDSAEETKKAS